MSILKREEFVAKSFQNYFQATGRLMFQLNELIEILKIESDPFRLVEEAWNQVKDQECILIFKWLIFFNKVIMDFIVEPSFIAGLIQKVHAREDADFEILLNRKLIKPYKLYLMKRCQFLPKKSGNIDKMYQLMNLIQAATSFSEIIYTLGRYYAKTYPFAADFNIILGNDLNTVYNQMVKYTPKPASCEILEEYEKIHQKMYIIYYNCYFYKYLKPFVPRWVVTDCLSPQLKVNERSPENIKSNKSLAETNTTSSTKKISNRKIQIQSVDEFNLTKSSILQFSPQKNQQFEQSLMLLKSMERVFQELPQI